MTIPISLNTISNLQDTTTAQTNLNANNATITGGFSTALNVIGDQMKGNLDMNSNQILNLPAPATANSPVRLVDVTSSSSIASVPPVGTSGAVVPLLNSNNTWSGTNTFGTITGSHLPLTNINNTYTGTQTFNGPIAFGSSATGMRIPLTGTTNFYVNASTGNDSNPGTLAAPFKTIGAGVAYIEKNVDISGFTVILNVAAGTYVEQVQVSGSWIGSAAFNLTGAGSGTTIIQAPAGDYCIYCLDYGTAQVSGFTLQGTSSLSAGAIVVGQYGVCDIVSDVVFGSFPGGAHISLTRSGSMNMLGNYSISGSAGAHWAITHGGQLTIGSAISISMTTALAFTEFVQVVYGGHVSMGTNWTATGAGVAATTGTKFVITDGGIIQANGADLNTIFPGSASGAYFLTSGFDSTFGSSLTTVSASPTKGYIAVITDATATTPNSTVTGGSTNTVLAWYNGSAWKIIAS